MLCHLREVLPDDAIVTNGAGNYSAFVQRYYRYRAYPSQLAPTSGSMGYGLPAAIAAKLVHPERAVVCFAGDGCFQMTGQELATAMQYGLAIIVIVANNSLYGSIRMHQEVHYPGRVIASELHNPDFAALAHKLRRARGDGDEKRGLPGRLRAGRERRAGRVDRASHRPRGDHPDPDAARPSPIRRRIAETTSFLDPSLRRRVSAAVEAPSHASRYDSKTGPARYTAPSCVKPEQIPCPRLASRP